MLSRFIPFTTVFTALISPNYPVSNIRRKQAEIWLLVLKTYFFFSFLMSSDGDNKNKPDLFLRIGWAAGAERAPSEGAACLIATARCTGARSFATWGEHRFLTHRNLPRARLGLPEVPPGRSPPEHHAQPGGHRTPRCSAPCTHLRPTPHGAGGRHNSSCQTSALAHAAAHISHLQRKDVKTPGNITSNHPQQAAGLPSPCAHGQDSAEVPDGVWRNPG